MTRQALLALMSVVALGGVAQAGPFGGFIGGDSYLRGTDQVCRAVERKLGMPSCVKRSPEKIARLTVDEGRLQRGSGARVEARQKGTRIGILPAGGGAPLAVWDAGTAVHKLGDVYLSAKGDLVAVEYTTRFGGRSVEDVVVIALPASALAAGASSGGGAASGVADHAASPATSPRFSPLPEDPPEVARALAAARKQLRRKRWARGKKRAEVALAKDADHPEARFLVAWAKLGAGDRAGAIAALEAIAASGRRRAPIWLVEARQHKAFAALRGDPAFRKAVGLVRDPDRPVTAYERLVGLGGRWEQSAIPCEQARVNLDLHRGRKAQRFNLVIRSRCRGMRETTRLDGSWQSAGSRDLQLVFPNHQGPDETMTCRLELCSDGSGEDCLRCQPEPDLEFLLRVVRR